MRPTTPIATACFASSAQAPGRRTKNENHHSRLNRRARYGVTRPRWPRYGRRRRRPQLGTGGCCGGGHVPIGAVIGQIGHVVSEIGALSTSGDTPAQTTAAVRGIFGQIGTIGAEVGHIEGAHNVTVSNTATSHTVSETGHNQAASFSIGIGPATATASATTTSRGGRNASATAVTAVASVNGVSDAVAAAQGGHATATTSVGP